MKTNKCEMKKVMIIVGDGEGGIRERGVINK